MKGGSKDDSGKDRAKFKSSRDALRRSISRQTHSFSANASLFLFFFFFFFLFRVLFRKLVGSGECWAVFFCFAFGGVCCLSLLAMVFFLFFVSFFLLTGDQSQHETGGERRSSVGS